MLDIIILTFISFHCRNEYVCQCMIKVERTLKAKGLSFKRNFDAV